MGTRTECIRERAAPSRKAARTLQTLYAEARIPKGSGPFSFLTSTGLRIGADPRSMDRTTGDGGRSLTTCCEATSVLADGLPRNFCGCSSVGRARPRHESWVIGATSSRLVIRSTSGVSFHSVAARHGVGGAGCARPLARPRAARHHIRRDARVWAQPKWISIALVAQQAEQPPCKRQAARSNRRRGHHQSSRVRLDGRGHHSFKVDTRVRIPHATPAQGTLVELTLRGWKSAATIGRRRNP